MEIPNKMYVAKTPYGVGRVTRPLHFISVLCKIFARSSGGCRIRPYENRERCNFSAFYPQHTDNPKSSRLIPYKNFSCRKKAEQNQFRIRNYFYSVVDGFPVTFERIMFDMNHNLIICIDQIVSAILINGNSE